MNAAEQTARCRLRDLGIFPGVLETGPRNDITDVAGVRVGQVTLIEGDDVRTGATVILPHGGNLFQEKVPAGAAVANGFGKMTGYTQIVELGEIETPIVLTNTLAVGQAIEAILDWTLAQPGNEKVCSINAVVGETNDGWLNDIRKRALKSEHIRQAIESAAEEPVAEGAVGAGTGTICFGWKGGMGSSSRRLPDPLGGYTLGALVQTNFGGILQVCGFPLGQRLGQHYLKDQLNRPDGSIMIVLATDAPLSDRDLTRLARRAFAGLARTGSAFSDGSGDYALAFSTAAPLRRTPRRRAALHAYPEPSLSPLFLAAIEATEEAIYNSLCMASTMRGHRGTITALPLEALQQIGRSPSSP